MNLFASPASWSLKTKLALGSGLLIFALSVASTALMLRTMQDDVRRSVTDTQTSLARATARDIDDKIEVRQRSLAKTAEVLSAQGLTSADALDAFFSTRPLLVDLFDGLIVIDAAGRIVFDLPKLPGRRGVVVSDRDYFKRAMAGAGSVISSPFVARPSGQPTLVFATPLKSADGKVTAVLGGGLNLLRPNFLGALGDVRIGHEGYFVVFEKGARPMTVMHAYKDRIMTPAPDAKTNPQLAQALAGYEGTLQGVNSMGVETLRTYVGLKRVPWVLSAVYPTAEAFAGLRSRQIEMLVIAGLLCLLASGVSWFMVQRLLRPLTQLQAAMARPEAEREAWLPAAGRGSAELVAVLDAYHAQSERRLEFERQLRASKRRLRAITDNVPALIAHIDTDARYTFVNAQYGHLGCGEAEAMLGRHVAEVRGAEFFALIEPYAQQALAGVAVSFETARAENGRTVHRQSNFVPDRDDNGQVRGFFVMTLDVTERKQAELRLAASERQLHELTNNIPAMVGYFDMQERCLYANDSGLRLQGLTRADIPGISLRAALGDAIYAQHEPYVKEALQGRRARLDGHVAFANREAHFQAHLIPDRIDGGAQRGFYLMTFDITALKEAQGRQARVERQLRAITDNLPVLISYVDKNERFAFANRTFKDWLGVDPAAVLGRTMAEVPQLGHRDERPTQIRDCLAGERVSFESELQAQGITRSLQTTYIPDILSSGEVAGFYALSTDVTPLKQAERSLNLQVRRDTLTGIANRYQFNEILPLSLARCRRVGLELALMFLDIDHFKQINDTHGHAVGDAALKEFAQRLQRCVRMTDTVARLAGDEFVVIVEGLHDASEAQLVARKIVAEIARPFQLDALTLAVTTSVGIACTGAGAVTGPELLAQADAALYEAKAKGRNRFHVSTV